VVYNIRVISSFKFNKKHVARAEEMKMKTYTIARPEVVASELQLFTGRVTKFYAPTLGLPPGQYADVIAFGYDGGGTWLGFADGALYLPWVGSEPNPEWKEFSQVPENVVMKAETPRPFRMGS
jgi:hypothetical protein